MIRTNVLYPTHSVQDLGIMEIIAVVKRTQSLTGKVTHEGIEQSLLKKSELPTSFAVLDTPEHRVRLAFADIPYNVGTCYVSVETEWYPERAAARRAAAERNYILREEMAKREEMANC